LAATVEVSAGWALGLGLSVLAVASLAVMVPVRRASAEDGDDSVSRPGRSRWLGPVLAVAARRGVAAGIVCAAFVAGLIVGRVPRVAEPIAAGVARVEAVVRRVDHRVRGVTSDVVVVAGERVADRAAIRRGARVRVVGAELPLGARVKLLAAITPLVPYRNPTPHPKWPGIAPPDARAQIPRGARARVIARDVWAEGMQGARGAVRAALDRTLAPDVAGVARALVLGDGDAVDPASEEAVRGAGLAHVLAVSGLHVTILVGLIVWALRRALLYVPAIASRVDPQRVAAALGIPIVLAYAAFAGGEPSAWRAAVTAAIAWALVAAARRPHPLSVAAAALIVLTATAPHEATRPALLLSILATAAVLTTTRRGAASSAARSARGLDELDGPKRQWHAVASLVRDGLALSLRTTIATAPSPKS
jgi:competence protein ComEC